MRNVKKYLVWVLLPLFVAAMMFGVELSLQKDTLSIPADQRKVTDISLAEIEADGVMNDGEALIAEGNATVSLPVTGYVHTLVLQGNDARGSDVTVTWEGGRSKVMFLAAGNEVSVQVKADVNGITVDLPAGVTLEKVQVDNALHMNGSRMLLVALLSAAVYLLLALNKVIGKKMEYGFLIVALAIGIFMSICMPMGTNISYDDQIHAQNVLELSRAVVPAKNTNQLVSEFWSVLEGGRAVAASAADSGEEVAVNAPWQFSYTGYVPSVIGMTLARVLGMSVVVQIIAARLFGMLSYVLLAFMAIKALGRFKLLFSAIALMPTPMFLAANFSYDPFGLGLCFAGIALTVDAMIDPKHPVTWQRGLCMLLALMAGSLTKVVYMPLLLLVLLIPNRKFGSTKLAVWFKLAAVVICLLGLVFMVADVAGDAAILEDSRGEDVNSAAQIQFILSHPFQYLGYFFTYFWEYFKAYVFDYSRTVMAYLGGLTGTWSDISLWVLLFVAFTDNDPEYRQKLGMRNRIAFLLIAGVVIGMIFTTMYVAFSPVGKLNFGGVQGRYLLPVLPLCMMVLSPDGIENKMNKRLLASCIFLFNLLILGMLCWNNILNYVPVVVVS
ncbi:MAG: DUF2142 domain-containing protein [Clostridia bacterium]|nr:DUF2142 domain-containing protein [Clostridia bacterium]